MINIKNLPPIERKSDGSLPQMTQKQKNEAVKIIRKICCNYDKGNCILLDTGEPCVCVQSITYSVNCKYFRHVLLEDKEGQQLKAQLFHDKTIKQCAKCGKYFQSKANNVKYCKNCAKDIHKRRNSESMRKARLDVYK